MIRRLLIACSALVSLSLPSISQAATEAQKVTAIQNGLGWLSSTQTAGGYWNYGGYEQAATAAAVGAFVSQKSLWGSNAAAYQTRVDNAMNYLLSTASVANVTTRLDGGGACPGGAASCKGVYWYGAGETTYTTGIVASAIGQYAAANPLAVATNSGPLAGMTYRDIAQGITNEFTAGQTTANNNLRGGWRYFPGSNDSDGSTTQWAVLSMMYDQSLGAVTPGVVKSELANYWLKNIQDGSGAGCYQPGYLCEHSDTGSLLIAASFVGEGPGNAQVDSALNWVNNNWGQGANNTWYGNFGHPYAMWALYKGLELQIGKGDTSAITNLASGCGAPGSLPGNPPGATACNWWQDYNQWLVSNQNGDGSWNGYSYWNGPLATAWNVSILGGIEVPKPPEGVPEPSAWSMMLLGFGGLGALLRRRRSRTALAA